MADTISGSDKRIAAGLLAIFLGSLGIHKFYLGYNTAGIIMLVVSLFSCGTIMGVIGLIEGIIYLTRTDEQFTATYVVGKKEWF
jgi:TM2 domain-containing membrane protein YozV